MNTILTRNGKFSLKIAVFQLALRGRGTGNFAGGFFGGGVFTRNDHFDHSVLFEMLKTRNIEHLLIKISMAYGYMKYEVKRHNRSSAKN